MEIMIDKQQISNSRKHLKLEQRSLLIKRFFSNRLAVTGSVIILLATLVSLFAPLITPYLPLEMNPANRLQPPSSDHLFGTDIFGRDLFTRVVYGIRVSLLIGFTVTILSTLIGAIIGLYASYYRTLDHILMRICDGLLAFPAILLAIAIVGIMGASPKNVVLALAIVFIPTIARIVRSNAMIVREQTYIEALKAMGARSWRIIWLHIAPNTVSPLIIQATFVFSMTIIMESMLSFLGAGIPAPEPSLGNILLEGKEVIIQAWWVTIFPGATIIAVVLGLNLFGDGLRDILDPHLNRVKK